MDYPGIQVTITDLPDAEPQPGKPGTKVTIEDIMAKIRAVTYVVLPDQRTMICSLTMENGFTVHGKSACVDIANFDQKVGEQIAFKDAVNQVWPLEGYLLAQRLHNKRQFDGLMNVVHEGSVEGAA